MKDRRVVIVGATGFIGARLAAHAHAAGADVVAVGSRDCDFLDGRAVADLFRRVGDRAFTVIFLAVVNKSVENTYEAYRDNVTIVRHLVEGLRGRPLERLIHFSSVDVYGRRPPLPIREDTPIDPDTWYGLAKYSGEWMVRATDEVRAPVTVLRIPGVYGAGPNDLSVVGRMARSFRETGSVMIRGDGRRRRDYVYVGDVCRVVEALLPVETVQLLNVATGRALSVLEVAQTVAAALGRPGAVVTTPERDAARDFDLVFDVARLRAVMPDVELVPLAEGLAGYRD